MNSERFPEHDRELAKAARTYAEAKGIREPTASDVASLLSKARARRRPRQRAVWAFGASAVALATIAAVMVVRSMTASPTIVVDSGGVRRELAVTPSDGVVLEASATALRIASGTDEMRLDAHSTASLHVDRGRRTRIALTAGRVVCHVAKRPAPEFEVVVGTHVVRVVGTQFSVRLGPSADVEVAVAEGRVSVDGGAVLQAGEIGSWRDGTFARTALSAARRGAVTTFDDEPEPAVAHDSGGAQSAAPTAKPEGTQIAPPNHASHKSSELRGETQAISLTQFQDMVLAGRYDDALRGLSHHLAAHPRDREAWALFADTQRKSARPRQAVAAYMKVIGLGEGDTANRARFLAATVHQDELNDPVRAAKLLRAYLRDDSSFQPLRGAAMLRLGRALAMTGDVVEAHQWLRAIIQQFPGTAEAEQANTLEGELP